MSKVAKIYGRRPVEEAFEAKQRFEQVWLDHRLSGPFADDVRRWCGEHNCRIPPTSTQLKPRSIRGSPKVEPWPFTPNLRGRLRTL